MRSFVLFVVFGLGVAGSLAFPTVASLAGVAVPVVLGGLGGIPAEALD